jgi:hypothetical protein
MAMFEGPQGDEAAVGRSITRGSVEGMDMGGIVTLDRVADLMAHSCPTSASWCVRRRATERP